MSRQLWLDVIVVQIAMLMYQFEHLREIEIAICAIINSPLIFSA